ncbi:MAG: hypothetical protein ACRCYE_05445 [Sarcina sp.]
MWNLSKRKKVANEVIELITEYEDLIKDIRPTKICDIEVSNDYREIKYSYGKRKIKYSHYLDNVSEIYSPEFEEGHIKQMKLTTLAIRAKANEEDNEELLKIDLIQNRCKEIYNRLKYIDNYIMQFMR